MGPLWIHLPWLSHTSLAASLPVPPMTQALLAPGPLYMLFVLLEWLCLHPTLRAPSQSQGFPGEPLHRFPGQVRGSVPAPRWPFPSLTHFVIVDLLPHLQSLPPPLE